MTALVPPDLIPNWIPGEKTVDSSRLDWSGLTLKGNGPFTNLPPTVGFPQVDWISETIGHAERSGVATVEAFPGRPRTAGQRPARRSPTLTLFPKVEFVDLRRQHSRQEEHGYVLHGRHVGAYRQQLEAVRNGRLQRVRLHGVEDDVRPMGGHSREIPAGALRPVSCLIFARIASTRGRAPAEFPADFR